MTEPWKHLAACRNKPTNWWFPVETRTRTTTTPQTRNAITICKSCPVATNCLTHALEQPENHGIWGGLTSEQRRAMLKQPVRDIPHGTRTGYNRHIQYRHPPCEPCKAAHREYAAALRRIRKRAQTRHTIDPEGS